jgi:putative sugar O-methyltransferase
MTAETDPLLETLHANYTLAQSLGLPPMKSAYWGRVLDRKGAFVGDAELWEAFRSNVVSEGLDNANVPAHARARVERRCVELLARLEPRIPTELHHYFEESDVGRPQSFEIRGRRVSQSSLEYTYMLWRLAPLLRERPDARVVEIGGGFGGLARVLKSEFPGLRYTIFDLPEANAIQTWFLGRSFPRARFRYLADVPAAGPLELDGSDFLLLPGPLAARLPDGRVDLFVNTRSMMEMDVATVAFYFEQLQRAVRPDGAFYCVNRHEKYTRLKDYPFDARWRARIFEPWPTWIDAAPHHEILAERTAGAVGDLCGRLAALPPSDAPLARLTRALGRLRPRGLRRRLAGFRSR